MNRPNIIFVECDSMDGRAMGSMGLAALKNATPTMDKMTQEGVLFQNMYTNNPICCCSRASMLSGQYTHHCHGWNNYKGLPQSQPTLFSELENGGYRMGIFGKTDYVSGKHTARARVSAWTRTAKFDRPEYNMDAPVIIESNERRVHAGDWRNTDAAIQWMCENASSGEPFFLYVGLHSPHPSFYTSRYYLDQIDIDAIDLPPKETYSHPVVENQRKKKAWRHGDDPETVRKVRSIYYAMIAETDRMLGEITNASKELGLSDNTYIVFTSDHGECNMEHGQYYKMNMFEPAMRVPLLVTGPGVCAGHRVPRMVSLVDLFPTVMAAAGLETTLPLDGHNLLPEIMGKESALPNVAFGEYHDCSLMTGTSMVREDDWKYIAFAGYEPLLFNLADDPWEVNNLAEKMPEKAAQMKELLYSISNLDDVNRMVRELDQDSFRIWRDEQISAGTYRDTMARIFSGWDGVKQGEGEPWTDQEEEKILLWLEEMP